MTPEVAGLFMQVNGVVLQASWHLPGSPLGDPQLVRVVRRLGAAVDMIRAAEADGRGEEPLTLYLP